MNSDNDTDEITENDGGNRSLTPSITKLKRMIGASPASRRLTPSEIDLLRQSAKEIAEVTRGVLASKVKPSKKLVFDPENQG